MSARLPPKPRKDLSVEQQEGHDLMDNIFNRAFGPSGAKFVYENDEGAFVGPFPFFVAAPQVGKAMNGLLAALAQLPIPPDARETAILAVGGHFQAGYETYSHVPQAIDAGLTREQAETLQRDGSKPSGLSETCEVACDVARYLVSQKGPLPQGLWDKSVELLGKDGTVGLLHYVGVYSYVCVALNGMDAPVPEK